MKANAERYYSSANIRKIGAVYNIIYGKRSKGKTYDMLYNIVKEYWEARKQGVRVEAMYLRRWDTDIKTKEMETVCDNLVHNGEGVNVIKEITGGQYDSVRFWNRKWYLAKTDPNTGLVNKDKDYFMSCMALNTWGHTKGGSYPFVKTLWFEEFIKVDTDRYLEGEFKAFQNVVSTIVRKRTDVTIWMTGNTTDPFCPYFEEMGLTRVNEQPQGTIDTYKLGKSGKKIAVERTKDTGKWKDSEINNDYYFAFSNPELKMITDGDWEIGLYPLQTEDIKPMDVCGRFFVQYKNWTMQCDIISNYNYGYIYVHKDIDPLQPLDEEHDLIYTTQYNMRPNYRRDFRQTLSDGENVIKQLINMDKILYDSNPTGNAFEAYLKWTRGL